MLIFKPWTVGPMTFRDLDQVIEAGKEAEAVSIRSHFADTLQRVPPEFLCPPGECPTFTTLDGVEYKSGIFGVYTGAELRDVWSFIRWELDEGQPSVFVNPGFQRMEPVARANRSAAVIFKMLDSPLEYQDGTQIQARQITFPGVARSKDRTEWDRQYAAYKLEGLREMADNYGARLRVISTPWPTDPDFVNIKIRRRRP